MTESPLPPESPLPLESQMPSESRDRTPARLRSKLANRTPARSAAVALAIAAVAMVATLVPLTRWAKVVTGEESLAEAAKGAVALSLLQIRTPGGPAELAPYAPGVNKDVSAEGVNAFLQLEADPAVMRRTFDVLAAAGVRWVRQEFPWEDIEIHGRGDFEDRRQAPYRSAWEKYDRIVDEAGARGIHLLVRLDNPPEWSFADPAASGEKGPPDDAADFANFVAAVAERYCGRVRYYQIWNEPNIYPEWGERDVDPTGYVGLLASAAAHAREACPGVGIVSAALAPTTAPGGRNLDDLAYLEALYKAGWQGHFDVLAAQGFGLWTGPTDRRASRDRTNFARVMLAREIMVANGDEAKPVWITEMGWTSPPENLDAPDRDKYGRTTEAVRARYIRDAYARIADEWPWVGVAFVWMLRRPDWEWHTRPEGWFRLVEPDWVTTPAFDELAALASAPPTLPWGRHLPTHPALGPSGPWQPEAPPGTGIVGAPGAELVFPFEGNGYELRVAPESAFKAFIVLDGLTGTVTAGPTGQVDEGEVGLAAHGLDGGDHTGIVRVDEGSLVIHDLVVEADGADPWWLGALLPMILLATVAVTATWSLWRILRPR